MRMPRCGKPRGTSSPLERPRLALAWCVWGEVEGEGGLGGSCAICSRAAEQDECAGAGAEIWVEVRARGGWCGVKTTFGVGARVRVRVMDRHRAAWLACGWPQRRVLEGTRVPLATHRRTWPSSVTQWSGTDGLVGSEG